MSNSGKYDDIIHLPRPVSPTRSPMPMQERAAQFSPFAALSGYDGIIREAARRTTAFVEPDEDRKQELNRLLEQIRIREKESPRVRLTWFVPDGLLPGGEYVTDTVTVRRVDTVYRMLELEDRSLIRMDYITDLELL